MAAMSSSIVSKANICSTFKTSESFKFTSRPYTLKFFPLNRNTKFSRSSVIQNSKRLVISSSSVTQTSESELDLVSRFSEVVPDTVMGDDFERFKPTAATVTSSLLLGFSALPEAKYEGAIRNALAYGECMVSGNKFSCFLDKALVNVGKELSKMVAGRVSTEVDPRLANDADALIDKVRTLLRLYAEVEVPREKLLFKLPATWQGIEAARQLEDDGIQTHLTGVSSFAQAAACAQAKVSVIQIPVGRIRDWVRNNQGADSDLEGLALKEGDVGLATVSLASSFIALHSLPTKVMASNLRNRDDVMGLLGVDYLIVPLRLLESLRNTPASGEEVKRVVIPSPETDKKELLPWSESRFNAEVGTCGSQLLFAEIESAVSQTEKVEQHFQKIWPPPNV